jgi:hypothetical protein
LCLCHFDIEINFYIKMDCSPKVDNFEIVTLTLQLADFGGFPVAGVVFIIKLKVKLIDGIVNVEIPTINFQTGQISLDNPDLPLVVNGGYLYTISGSLPKHLRPVETIFQSYLGASNSGLTPVTAADLSNPITAYIIQITDSGELIIQGAGQFGNLIPPGNQVLLQTNVTYFAKKRVKLGENIKISEAIDTTQFTDPHIIRDQLRDSHVNDAFDGISAWSWTDNSTVSKTQNTLNVFVAVGEKDKCGIKIKKTTNLTNFPPNIFAFDTAVAINRINKKNLIVSWGQIDLTVTPNASNIFRAVSFDEGKTWPTIGPVLPVVTPFGDARGVAADRFGNFWYSYTDGTTPDFIPHLLISLDGGITFNDVPLGLPSIAPGGSAYDYPQICFGGDGLGNYGIWMTADVIDSFGDVTNVTVFVPIIGLGQTGTPVVSFLFQFIDTNLASIITASADGRLWYESAAIFGSIAYTYCAPVNVIYKSPGPINQNLVGPWNLSMATDKNLFFGSQQTSQTDGTGYLYFSAQSIVFDDKRQALYAMLSTPHPINNQIIQNMRLIFRISRNNGQTWSDPIAINNNDFANRGFQSMALDSVTGDLIFGWYDGRNDANQRSLEYFVTIISAKELDELVKDTPISDPTYIVPYVSPLAAKDKTEKKKVDLSKIPRYKRLMEKLNKP